MFSTGTKTPVSRARRFYISPILPIPEKVRSCGCICHFAKIFLHCDFVFLIGILTAFTEMPRCPLNSNPFSGALSAASIVLVIFQIAAAPFIQIKATACSIIKDIKYLFFRLNPAHTGNRKRQSSPISEMLNRPLFAA